MTSVEGVVGHMGKMIALIHFKSPPPILTLVNHVSHCNVYDHMLLVVKLTPSRPITIEVKFTCLEALVISMET
jgi:hypothetical protein